MAVQPRQASAVMLLRDAPSGQGLEVFMVRRVIQSDFMPDVYVFPGGSVQQDDLATELLTELREEVTLDITDPEGRTALGTGTRAAAIRELFEEGGILLAYQDKNMLAITLANSTLFANYRRAFNERQGSLVEMAREENLVLATRSLGYFTHWITPEGMPKRFDTHFFITTAPVEQQAAYDQLETSEGIWISPTEALERAERNEFPLVFATLHQLHELAAFTSTEEALQAAAGKHVETYMPVLVEQDGQLHVHLPGDDENLWAVPAHMTRFQS